MDDGELEFSNHDAFSDPRMGDMPNSCSMDSFFDEIFKDTHACTHTHTCNPPGPDLSHTHTCFHVHTKIMSPPSEENAAANDTLESAESAEKKSKKRPIGNREAVRKYREKKKARTASLEDEVNNLRGLNQQLLKRLQGQAVLESEISRLRCLLVDIRGRIDGEIGSFPYQKYPKGGGEAYQNMVEPSIPVANILNPCNIQCDDWDYCLRPEVGEGGGNEEGFGVDNPDILTCGFESFQCTGNTSSGLKGIPSCLSGNTGAKINPSFPKKKRGVGANKAMGISPL